MEVIVSYKRINVAVIGAGWVGGIRINACASSPLVNELHIAEINPDRTKKIADNCNATSFTTNWKNLIDNESIDAIIIASTPVSERFPIVRAALKAKKHVMIEKPIAPTLREADEAIKLIEVNNLKFTIGYTRRCDPKYAFINKSLKSGKLGQPVTCLISRNITREIGNK